MESLFHLIFRPEVIVFFVPISAILGGFYYAVQKMKYKQMGDGGMTQEDKLLMAAVLKENAEIKQRLQNLESIITSMDKEILALKTFDDENINQQRVKELSDKMKRSSDK